MRLDTNKMKFWQKDKNTFFCFTPEVMLITLLIEFSLAVYAFIRYRMTAFGRLVILLLILLGGFQLAEYQICSNSNLLFWSRFGFAVITFLPVLGLHLISLVTGKSRFLKFGYILMFAYIAIFAFTPNAITGAVCGGNYIIFYTGQKLAWTYTVYFFGFLLLSIWEALENISPVRGSEGSQLASASNGMDAENRKNLLIWIILGYGSVMIPMGIVYVLSLEARQAIPSIMCGFAIILAFILAFKVAPKYQKLK